jgi:hypothetical protein
MAVLSPIADVESTSCYQQDYQPPTVATPPFYLPPWSSVPPLHHPFIVFADIISCCKTTRPLILAGLPWCVSSQLPQRFRLLASDPLLSRSSQLIRIPTYIADYLFDYRSRSRPLPWMVPHVLCLLGGWTQARHSEELVGCQSGLQLQTIREPLIGDCKLSAPLKAWGCGLRKRVCRCYQLSKKGIIEEATWVIFSCSRLKLRTSQTLSNLWS